MPLKEESRSERSIARLRAALVKSYGWKSPVERTKGGACSPVLYLAASVFFIARLFWLVQVIKVVLRTINGVSVDLKPAYNEIYIFISLLCEVAVLVCASSGAVRFNLPSSILEAIVIWKILEVISGNMYYLLFRPIFEKDPPHNLYRSALLAGLGLIQVWLLLGILWYFFGETNDPLNSVTKALYFTTVSFFTGAYGEIHPQDSSLVLAIFTMFTSLTMIGIVLSRGLAIVKPLPDYQSGRRLILVMGTPGTGKSTFARALVARSNVVYLNSDFLSDGFTTETRASSEYLLIRDSIYSGLYRTARENLMLGNSVLIDAPHVKPMRNPDWRTRLIEMVVSTGSQLRIIRCHCAEAELRSRLLKRSEPRDKPKLSAWTEFLSAEPLFVDIPFAHLDVDTQSNLDTNVSSALAYIQSDRQY